jgi:hypothetical protein
MDDIFDFIKPEPKIDNSEDDVKVQKLGIFDILNCITYSKEDLDFSEDILKKAYNQYMINRWLSMNEHLFAISEIANKITNLTDEQHYDMLRSVIPKRRYQFNYLKKIKDVSAQQKKYIAHYYGIGLKDAEEYVHQMTEDDIECILNKYKYGKSEMVRI